LALVEHDALAASVDQDPRSFTTTRSIGAVRSELAW
jgi:hypothetical protein